MKRILLIIELVLFYIIAFIPITLHYLWEKLFINQLVVWGDSLTVRFEN